MKFIADSFARGNSVTILLEPSCIQRDEEHTGFHSKHIHSVLFSAEHC